MATDILGKIGEKVGLQINAINTDISSNYATKSELNTTNNNVADNATDIEALQSTKADKVSLANYANGTSVFSLIKGTRAELGELKVSGQMTVVNTQTVEVSDNFLELNKAETGTETAQTSGININRGSGEDKASLTWDDVVSKFKLLLGSSDADLEANKVYFKNVFATATDLPSASSNHGMFAHQHDTGRGKFAHNGQWVELLDVNGNQTIGGDLTVANGIAINAVANTGFKVNNVPLGDYASFETEFLANL